MSIYKPSIYKGMGIYNSGEGGSPTPPTPKPFPMEGVPDYTIVLRLADGVDNPPEYARGTLTKHPEYEAEWGNVWFLTYDDDDWGWGSLLEDHTEIVEILGANADNVTFISYMCAGCTGLVRVTLGDFPLATEATSVFLGCSALTSVTIGDLPNVTDIGDMFLDCHVLTSVTVGDLTNVEYMSAPFKNCYALTNFLPIYIKVKNKAVTVVSHSDAFTDCGIYTTAGTAELLQIPESWGGLAGTIPIEPPAP